MHAEKEDKEASILGGWLLGGLLCGDWWAMWWLQGGGWIVDDYYAGGGLGGWWTVECLFCQSHFPRQPVLCFIELGWVEIVFNEHQQMLPRHFSTALKYWNRGSCLLLLSYLCHVGCVTNIESTHILLSHLYIIKFKWDPPICHVLNTLVTFQKHAGVFLLITLILNRSRLWGWKASAFYNFHPISKLIWPRC